MNEETRENKRLLREEIEVADLQLNIERLLQSTFAFHQGNDDQRDTLQAIFVQRGHRVEPYVADRQFKVIKRSGSDLRFYELIKDKLELENDVWVRTDTPTADEWIDHIFSLLFSLPQMIAFISEWNENRRIPLTADVLKRITTLWLSGKWYADIADEVGTDVQDLLSVFSAVLGSHFQIYASRAIRVASLLLEQASIEISPVLLNWPLYLTYGLQHKTELDLTEVGLTDRDAIIALGQWLNSRGLVHNSTDGLRRELVRLRSDILQELKGQMTVISFEKLQRQMELLNHRNIL